MAEGNAIDRVSAANNLRSAEEFADLIIKLAEAIVDSITTLNNGWKGAGPDSQISKTYTSVYDDLDNVMNSFCKVIPKQHEALKVAINAGTGSSGGYQSIEITGKSWNKTHKVNTHMSIYEIQNWDTTKADINTVQNKVETMVSNGFNGIIDNYKRIYNAASGNSGLQDAAHAAAEELRNVADNFSNAFKKFSISLQECVAKDFESTKKGNEMAKYAAEAVGSTFNSFDYKVTQASDILKDVNDGSDYTFN